MKGVKMISEIIYLGKITRENPCNTLFVEFQFLNKRSTSEFMMHGRNLELDHDYYKYKSIERYDTEVIERIILSKERFCLKTFKSLQTNNYVEIFPCIFKTYYQNGTNKIHCNVHQIFKVAHIDYSSRYINDLCTPNRRLVDALLSSTPFVNNLNRELLRNIFNRYPWIEYSIDSLMELTQESIFDTNFNITKYVRSLCTHVLDVEDQENILNMLEPDLSHQDKITKLLTSGATYTTKHLATLINNEYRIKIQNQPEYINIFSNILKDHTHHDREIRICNDSAKDCVAAGIVTALIKYLNTVPYTDICIRIDVLNDKIIVPYCVSRHTSYACSLPIEGPNFKVDKPLDLLYIANQLKNYTEEFIVSYGDLVTIEHITLVKSWNEEMVIHLGYANITIYVDLSMFNIGLCLYKMIESSK
jgi:hypothetical protein